MSIRFAIASLDEAKAYLAHSVLGARLRECARLTLDVEGKTARDIFGSIDETKFRSSMTLFVRAAPDEGLFQRCIDKYFAGGSDPATACEALARGTVRLLDIRVVVFVFRCLRGERKVEVEKDQGEGFFLIIWCLK